MSTEVETDKNEHESGCNEKNEPGTVPNMPLYKSVVLAAFGGPKHLRIESMEVKPVGKMEVMVEVEACGVNFLDVMMRQGLMDHALKPPFVLGSECTGTICEVGENVTKFKVGDPVVVVMENGAWAERIVVPVPYWMDNTNSQEQSNAAETENHFGAIILPRPKSLDAIKAAGMAFAYLPAYLLLHHIAHIKRGDVVLVYSAGGGVGTAIVQLAKLIPNVKLIGIASRCKHESLSKLYDVILSPDTDYQTEIKNLYPKGINIVFDCLSGEEINKCCAMLKPLGQYVLYGMSNLVSGDRKNIISIAKHWFHVERINPLKLHDENRLVSGFSLKSLLFSRGRDQREQVDLITEVWTELIALVNNKQIDPLVDSEWHLDEVKEAMARLQERKNLGKVVFIPKLKETEPAKVETNAQPNEGTKTEENK